MQQAYGDKSTVTDELVECILKPGLTAGAVDVFLDFISYSGGPLPEELLAQTSVSVDCLSVDCSGVNCLCELLCVLVVRL